MPKRKAFHFLILLCFVISGSQSVAAQTKAGINFHYSQNTRVGIYADIYDRVILEGRIVDYSLFIDTPFEVYGFYKFLRKTNYEVYGGFGYSFSAFPGFHGAIFSIGTNIYPFENKKFGFHVELNPVKGDFAPLIIKGSWGMRYTFDWSEEERE